MMVRMQEDLTDLKRKLNNEGENDMKDEDGVFARFLDLWKAYPLRIKLALWILLELYGTNGRYLEIVLYLHETTKYKMRGRDEVSKRWMPARVVPLWELKERWRKVLNRGVMEESVRLLPFAHHN